MTLLRRPLLHKIMRIALLAGGNLMIAGCGTEPLEMTPTAEVAPVQVVRAAAPQIVAPAAPDSISAYFRSLEAQRLSNGLLRQTRAPADLPFSERDLEEIFVQVALYDEYVFANDRILERTTPSTLRRWEAPVRMRLEFSTSVPATIQRADRAVVAGFASRLGRLTGHPVTLAETGANFHVLVLTEEDRQKAGPKLRQIVPGIDDTSVALVEGLPLTVSCLVLAFSRLGTDVYTDAVAVIRAELPDLSRRACYYEELAQGMGLPNDSPRARPSLFNDTAEFAVMTSLDEKLLRLLYDARLSPGMREREARPIIREIAQELMGAQS